MSNKKTVSIVVTANGSQARREAQKTGDAFQQMNKRAAQQAQQIGQSLQMSGASLTATITAPLVALATLGVQASLQLDAARTKLTALLGSADAAKSRMEQLAAISARAVGVTQAGALQIDVALRAAGVSATNTIDKMITSIGKLNAAFKIDDQDGFIRNLSQIFSQGFEIADIKEAIGRVPIFREIMKSAFGTDDPAKLKQLKESGKLTLDSWMTGLAGAIDSDPRIKNITENLTTKLAKGMEKANLALAPLGDVILNVIVPALEQLVPYVQAAAQWFQNLGPTAQLVAVAIGAVAAAIGPALVVIGGIAAGVGALIEVVGALGAVFNPVSLLIIAGVAQIAAIAAVAYAAWVTNFGGIRDLVQQVADVVGEAWTWLVDQVLSLSQDVLAEVSKAWDENGADIMAAVKFYSDGIRQGWETIAGFIRDNQETIKAILVAAWNAIKAIVIGAIQILSGVIKVIGGIIKGDWSQVWEGVKQIVSAAVNAIVAICDTLGYLVVGAVKLAFNAVWALGGWVLEESRKLGENIGKGLREGIMSYVDPIGAAGRWLGKKAVDAIGVGAETHSPSKATIAIGEFIGDGLIIGLGNRSKAARAAAKALAKEVLEDLKNAQKEFSKLAGADAGSVGKIQQTAALRDAASAQQKILELRRELGVASKPLPSTVGDTMAELKDLERTKAEAEALAKLVKEIQDYEDQRFENFEKKKAAIANDGQAAIVALQEEISLVGVTSELEQTRIRNYYDLIRLRDEMKNDGFSEEEIAQAEKLAQAEGSRRLELERILEIKKQVQAAGEFEKGLQEEIENLQRAGREMTYYERALREIQERYKDITPAQKERILELAREADAWTELRKRQEQVRDVIGNLVDAGVERGWKGVLDSIRSMFKSWLKKMLTDWLTSGISKIFGGGGGSGRSGGGGGIGGILQTIFGGGGSSGGGGGLGGIFSGIGGGQGGANGFAGGGGFNPVTGSSINLGTAVNGHATGGGAGGIGGAFGGLFSPQRNPVTGKMNSSFSGALGGIGAIASVVGGFLPGRLGNVVSMAGTGMSIGAMFGPWGALVGAIGGGLIGLFMGDPKRKKDKKENLPALRKGFGDSIAELRAMIPEVRRLAMDPDSAIARAKEIRTQVASGFGIQFLSKKYRKVAQSEIAGKLVEIDGIIKELEGVADLARSAGDRSRRMVPEFANGGMIPAVNGGMLIRAGEGGYNEFMLSTDPSKASRTAGLLAAFLGQYGPAQTAGGIGGGEVIEIPVTIAIDRDGMASGWAQSPNGKKVLVKVVEDSYSNDTLKLKRRTG